MDKTIDNLEKATDLKKEIRNIDYFLTAVNPVYQCQTGGGKKYVSAYINRETKVKYSIFGSRWFGCGSHATTIVVPDSLITDLHILALKRKEQLEKEFAELWHP